MRGSTWTWTAPLGRLLSGTIGVAALATAARISARGRRDPLLWTAALAPDISLLIGIAAAPTWHRMPSYAIRPYNALHHPAIPATLLTAAATTRHRPLTVTGLAWLGHIAWDRGCGYGPRDAEGYITGRGPR